MNRHRGEKVGRTYHYRPLLELLEQRRLLTSVTGQDPPPGSHDAPVTTDVSAVFDAEINLATVSAQTFAVHGMQTGQILESLSVSGDTVTLSPGAPFHAGELVQATVTTGIENLGGDPLADPFVWQFRTAASGGTGLFSDSGQSLGDSPSRAVALGDVDGDSDLDAFVANGNNEANKVWLNDGSGTFTDSGQSIGSDSHAVALADVDGDGDLDALVGNDAVWLNDGSGTFTDSGQNLGGGRRAVALGDIDGDGDLDAFVGYTDTTKVWLNDGGGNFGDSGQSVGDFGSEAVALGDVDGDGDLDAFVGNPYQSEPDEVWLNDGSGNFSDSGQSLGDSSGDAVALGDVDADGDLDAFVGGGSSDRAAKVWLNDGGGTFTDSGQSLENHRSSSVTLGDVDGDGDLDALVGNPWDPNKVWLNDGSGTFTDSGQNLDGNWTGAGALGDVDGDDDLDAFVGNVYDFHEGSVNKVWLNAGFPADLSVASNSQFLVTPGQSVTYTITVTNHGPQGAIGAIVTDNFPAEISDVSWTGIASAGASCTGSGTGNISDTISLPVGGTVTYTASGQLSPTASGAITNVATVAAPLGLDDIGPTNNTARDTDVVSAVDVMPQPGWHTAPVDTDVSATYDEEIDPAAVSVESFAVHGMQTGQILESLSVSGGTVTLSPTAPFHAGELVQATATAGIENLGGEPLADPFVWQFRTATSGGIGRFVNSGQSLGDSLTVALGDVDGDGDLDAFVGNYGYANKPNDVWLNDGSGNFSNSGQSLGSNETYAVSLGDVDEDGSLDAFVWKPRSDSDSNKVWLNDGTGSFTDSGQSLGDSWSWAVALGDVDGDGDLDAFIGNGLFGPETNKVWVNDGSGTFSDSGQSLGDSETLTVALGDVDGDGDLDAFVGNYGYEETAEPNDVWLNDGSGNFSNSGQSLGSNRTYAVSLGDVDGDGDLDAFIGNGIGAGPFHSEPNKVWVNDGSGAFSDSGQSLIGGGSTALGDVDGDGDLDSFAGDKVWLNDGSGNFTDSGQSLAGGSAALGDVDGDGDLDAFVTKVFLGNIGPNVVWLNQGPLLGDFDGDFDVDGDDFLIWQAGFGIQSGATRGDGDADSDGDVDGEDFLLWESDFGAGTAAGNASAAPTARRYESDRLDFFTPRSKAVDESFAELDRVSTRWTKRSLRDELLDELTLFK